MIVSGQLPLTGQTLLARGKVPRDVPLDQAQSAAAQCVLNALAILRGELGGDWSKFRRVVRVGVFVQSTDDFDKQPLVANGASELLVTLFGDAGRHARAAVGVNALPMNAAVEVEFAFEVADCSAVRYSPPSNLEVGSLASCPSSHACHASHHHRRRTRQSRTRRSDRSLT